MHLVGSADVPPEAPQGLHERRHPVLEEHEDGHGRRPALSLDPPRVKDPLVAIAAGRRGAWRGRTPGSSPCSRGAVRQGAGRRTGPGPAAMTPPPPALLPPLMARTAAASRIRSTPGPVRRCSRSPRAGRRHRCRPSRAGPRARRRPAAPRIPVGPGLPRPSVGRLGQATRQRSESEAYVYVSARPLDSNLASLPPPTGFRLAGAPPRSEASTAVVGARRAAA